MSSTRQPVFSAFAVSRTGNRGAVSMLESAIDHLTAEPYCGIVNVFTVYPKRDRSIPQTPNVKLFSGTPANLAFKLFPLCCLHRLVQALRLPVPRRIWGKEMAALLNTDVSLLIGGTTFTDEQVLKVIYNVACALPALLLGTPAMMYSQTIGPFRNWFNRLCARFCLSRMAAIVPRGDGSLKQVHELGFTEAVSCADSAFTLKVSEQTKSRIRSKYAPLLKGKTVVGVSVNSIVERKCRKRAIDHNGIWADFITYLQRKGYFVLLIPHSMRRGAKSRHNNDLMTLGEILRRLPSRDALHVVDEPYDCKELRVVVGLADYYVASRFHAMISALCTKTPVFVMGWGLHKYLEVLGQFGLDAYGRDAPDDMCLDALIQGFESVVREADGIRQKMAAGLAAVRESSMHNHLTAARLARQAMSDAERHPINWPPPQR